MSADVTDALLNHWESTSRSSVPAAYDHSALWPRKVDMMRAWSDLMQMAFDCGCWTAPSETQVIDLLIIDTLNCNLECDENAAKDMSNFIHGCIEIIDHLGCAIKISHHPSKGGSGGARGHSAFNGAADIGLGIKSKKDIFIVKMDAKPPKDDEPASGLRSLISATSAVLIRKVNPLHRWFWKKWKVG